MEELLNLKDAYLWFKKYLDERKTSGGFVRSGFRNLDNYIDGYYPGTFVVLGARPGVGKTTWLINQVLNFPGVPTLFVTTEFSKAILMEKLLSAATLKPHKVIRTNPYCFNGSLEKLMQEIGLYPLCMVDAGSPGTNDIRQIVYNLPEPPRIIIVDYFQNLFTRNSEAWEYAKNVVDLLALAKETKSTVICASQLKRPLQESLINLKDEKEYEPLMSDLKETGKLEEAAHLVMFLFQKNNELFLKIAKNRNGESGIIPYGVLWSSGRIFER